MEDAFVMGAGNLFRQDDAARQVLRHFAGDEVALRRGHDGVLVAVFLHDVLVAVADQGQDGFVRRIRFAHQGAAVAVNDVGLGQIEFSRFLDLVFHHILDVFHQEALLVFLLDIPRDSENLAVLQPLLRRDGRIGLADGHHNLLEVEIHAGAVPFNHFLHTHRSPAFPFIESKF